MSAEIRSLKEILAGVQKPTRPARQLEIEAQLAHFQADPLEAADMLPALLGLLIECDEIQHYATYLRRALERYSRRQAANEQDECDAFHADRAREEGMP